MPKRVLIVDDEDDIREVAQLSLEMMKGWEVLTAASGSEALIKAEAEVPDAILLDVMMPGMNGPTVVERLHENPVTATIPIVLLTAKVQSADHRHFSDLAIAGVLAKPFDPVHLAGDIARLLGWDD